MSRRGSEAHKIPGSQCLDIDVVVVAVSVPDEGEMFAVR